MVHVISFDIFDTCLTRSYAHPVDLFVEVGEIAEKNGWIAQTPREFARHRIAAEAAARKLVPSREVTFPDIYARLDLDVSPEILFRLQEAELEVEERALHPVAETLERVTRERRKGRLILFLSDMYLPVSFLQRVLERHHFFYAGDLIYVSGEVGRGKGTGGLFHYAREQVKVGIAGWQHIGDNRHSDVKVPRRLGLEAEHFEAGLLTRYELAACPPGGEAAQEKWRSRFAAAMRLARLSKPPELKPREKVLWDSGANLAGPLFYGYVKWILGQAREKGLERIHFIARDGQILCRIAGEIQVGRENPVECRYLHASRHAWVPASLEEVDDYQLGWILGRTPGLSLRQIFVRIDLAPEDYAALLESTGFPEMAWSDALDEPQLARLAELMRGPQLSAEIRKVAAGKREELFRYLRAQGVLGQDRIGIVDLGWHGSLKHALAQICGRAPDAVRPQVLGFYFALVDSPHVSAENFFAYANSVRPDLLGGFFFYMQLMEAFAAADHGQTRGYRDGEAVLARPDNPALAAWGLATFQESVLAFCRIYAALEEFDYRAEDYLGATLANMEQFYENPTLAEVQAWGEFPYSDQQVEDELDQLLPAWGGGRAMSAIFTKAGRKRLWWAPALAKREGVILLHAYYRLQKLWRTRLKPRSS